MRFSFSKPELVKPVAALCFLFLLLSVYSFSQDNVPVKTLPAKRFSGAVKVDGIPNEAVWQQAAYMTNLIAFRPKVGEPENPGTRTDAYLMYNDEGIYFGGFCHERTKDSIATELKGRDGYGVNDYIGIIFDTYHDKLNGFEYFVTPLNEQWDAKMSPPNPNDDNGGEDFSWNAVWHSGAVITDSGWSFEMFIPFSAIRFGKADIQDWGFHITRRRRKTEQQYTWNPVNPTVNGFLTQEGIWQGVSNIKPPLRLQFSPYLSFNTNHYPYNTAGVANWQNHVNGGMDVKYGINQAFTLDATLIPDFGQVQSDNQVLNLTPFEVKYNEYRPFFTEGTELFSKGDLFYSRRIGGTPVHQYDVYNHVNSNETVIRNPTESKLINATKISGRTQDGLGIGFLNAVTSKEFAVIANNNDKEERQYLTSPLTNYNVFVLDQTLKHNSSVSFINTNVWRSGDDYDANVSAALFDLYDKKNTWNWGGKFASSNRFHYLPDGKTQTGFSHELHFGKTSGRFNFALSQERLDTAYTSEDLGYFTNNNYLDHSLYAGYQWIEPKSWYNHLYLNFNSYLSFLSKKIAPIDDMYQAARMSVNMNAQTKTLWHVSAYLNYAFQKNDFYEPRTEGWFFKRGARIDMELSVESNDSKKYSFEADAGVYRTFTIYHALVTDITFEHQYRFNNKFSLSQSIEYKPYFNSPGYTYVDGSTNIDFARRNVNTVEHILSAKYNFTNRMGITFRARHYLSSVSNKEFYILQRDGSLLPHKDYHPSVDQNVNYFNIDAVYTWQFAPGSFLNIVWKDATQNYTNLVERSYFKNFGRTLTDDSNNNFSVKLIYFLDALQFKRGFHKA